MKALTSKISGIILWEDLTLNHDINIITPRKQCLVTMLVILYHITPTTSHASTTFFSKIGFFIRRMS